MSKAYQAYGTAGRVTKSTPRQAATAYFQQFPTSRKCDVVEGEQSEHFFTVKYGRASNGEWPKSFKAVTKKTANDLPDEN